MDMLTLKFTVFLELCVLTLILFKETHQLDY